MVLQKEESVPIAFQSSPVEVYTEWDPFEEVIVGVIDDMRIPEWDPGLDAVIPNKSKKFFKDNAGRRFPEELIALARTEIDHLANILSSEGIRVRRPNVVDHHTCIMPHHTLLLEAVFTQQCPAIVSLPLEKRLLKFLWHGEVGILRRLHFGKYFMTTLIEEQNG